MQALDDQRKAVPGRNQQRRQAEEKQADVLEVLSGYGRNLNLEASRG